VGKSSLSQIRSSSIDPDKALQQDRNHFTYQVNHLFTNRISRISVFLTVL